MFILLDNRVASYEDHSENEFICAFSEKPGLQQLAKVLFDSELENLSEEKIIIVVGVHSGKRENKLNKHQYIELIEVRSGVKMKDWELHIFKS